MSEAHFLDFDVPIPETIPTSEPTSNTELVITDLEPTPQTIMPSSQPNPEPITPSHSILPSVERNLNSGGDAKEQKRGQNQGTGSTSRPRHQKI